MKTLCSGEGVALREHGRKWIVSVDNTSIVVNAGAPYNEMVSGLVRARYPDEDAVAVLANYALIDKGGDVDTEDDAQKCDEYRKEFAAFTAWRRRVKDAVKWLCAEI